MANIYWHPSCGKHCTRCWGRYGYASTSRNVDDVEEKPSARVVWSWQERFDFHYGFLQKKHNLSYLKL